MYMQFFGSYMFTRHIYTIFDQSLYILQYKCIYVSCDYWDGKSKSVWYNFRKLKMKMVYPTNVMKSDYGNSW